MEVEKLVEVEKIVEVLKIVEVRVERLIEVPIEIPMRLEFAEDSSTTAHNRQHTEPTIVYVDRIVEVERVVERLKIIDRIIEVPVETIIEVFVERPA